MMVGLKSAPFFRALKKRRVNHTEPGYLEDELDPSAEATVVPFGAVHNITLDWDERVRVRFQLETHMSGFRLAHEYRMTQTYGQSTFMNKSIKHHHQHKIGIEKALLGSTGSSFKGQGNALIRAAHRGTTRHTTSTSIPRSPSVCSLFKTHVSVGAGAGAAGGWDSSSELHVAPTPGTVRTLDRALLEDWITNYIAIEDAEVDSLTLYCNYNIRRRLSGIGGDVEPRQTSNFNNKELPGTVIGRSFYKSDYGQLNYVTNKWIPTDTALILDMSNIKLGYMRLERIVEGPEIANSDFYTMVSTLGLCLERHERQGGCILAIQ